MSKITFEPFRKWFYTNHPTKKKEAIQIEAGLAPATATKVWNDNFDYFRSDVLEALCRTYDLSIEQVIRSTHRNSEYLVRFNEDGLPFEVVFITGEIVYLQSIDMENEDGAEYLREKYGDYEIVDAENEKQAAFSALQRRIYSSED